jgi:uncharacterized repeat protein (TIGR01451 family)
MQMARIKHSLTLLLVFGAVLALGFPGSQVAHADPYPPVWPASGVHYQPVSWPSEPANPVACGFTCGEWIPYTQYGISMNDPRIQDPSNGGTSPQNYVNIASSCIDEHYPSIYYKYDSANQVLLFRWRVEQIPNTYATGPNAGAAGATDPWKSGLWTVFFDVNGNGFRELAAHLNGSSGEPGSEIDRLVGIWGDVPNNQSLDYPTDPNIHLLGHNPTAFTSGGKVLNFHSGLVPDLSWPNGSAERVWNYGTTRSTRIMAASCEEFFIDYQIPLGMMDASGVNGPELRTDTPFAMLFCTANSLNDPLQKDCIFGGSWATSVNSPAAFGDLMTLDGGIFQQPLALSLSANGCSPANLSAGVQDALDVVGGVVTTTVKQVSFYYYYDANNNGQADDGGTWQKAADAVNQSLNQWTASWSSGSLLKGQYLVGARAYDDPSRNVDGKINVTFSYYLTQEELLAAEGLPPADQNWYVNPDVNGAVDRASFTNTCGKAPTITKSVDQTTVIAGGTLVFTITVQNPLESNLGISVVTDTLPSGFTYLSMGSGSLTSDPPTVAPGGSVLVWTLSPAAEIAPSGTGTLVFHAQVPVDALGTYSNLAQARTVDYGSLQADPVQVSVGQPRLSLAKSPSALSADPGDAITYTLSYANPSPVNVTGAHITDTLPLGVSFVSASNGGSYDSGTRQITWDLGYLGAGAGPLAVTYRVDVDNPYPDAAEVPLVNTAAIDSDQTAEVEASASVFITAPRPQLILQKTANLAQVAPDSNVVFTLAYTNTGNATATGVVLSDPIPTGFSFVSATGGGTNNSGTVTWNLPDLDAGASGSVQLTLKSAATYTATNPQTNTAAIDSDQTSPVTASVQVGVTQSGSVCNTYYFHQTTTDVGVDGSQKIATTTIPPGSGAALAVTLNKNVYTDIINFYQDPASTSDVIMASSINSIFYIDRDPGNAAVISTTVFDYDSVLGTRTLLGGSEQSFGGSLTGAYTVTVSANGTLKRNHRILWVVKGTKTTGNSAEIIDFQYDGTVTNSYSGGTRNALARAEFCTAPPTNLVFTKSVDKKVAAPGDSLAYTLRFSNVGQSSASSAQITDTLPAGVTYASATLNGGATSYARASGQQYTFDVNSSGQASGVVAAGGSGVLVINATVDKPLADGLNELGNHALLANDQTSSLTAAVTSTVTRPAVEIYKYADKSLLAPGETVVFTLNVVNNGAGAAANVTVSDVMPGAPLTFVANSVTLNGIPQPGAGAGGVLNLNIGSLPSGASAVITFEMIASSTSPATADNTASVSDDQTSGSRQSNTVTVAVSAAPRLTLTKTPDPTGAVEPGALITYTLALANSGASTAEIVQVADPIPADTAYVPGTLLVDSSAVTDARDGDAGTFDAAANRVLFNFATLGEDEAHTLSFVVRVNRPLSSGVHAIDNLATASASNAASRQATAANTASAFPVLELDKRGPALGAYPAAVLASAASTETIQVVDATQLRLGQLVQVGGTNVHVTAIDGSQVTLDGAVSAAAEAPVTGSLVYNLAYANTGDAAATSVLLTDTLPAGATFVSATGGGVYSAGKVTWSLGSLAVDQGGSVQVTILPGGSGSLLDQAALDCAETSPVDDDLTTLLGGLRLDKLALTPEVQQTSTGASAQYRLEVANTSGSTASGVVLTDTLPAGFTLSGSAEFGGSATRDEVLDPVSLSLPSWGKWSIPAGGSLVLTFTTDIDPSVGPGVVQNGFTVKSSNTPVIPFDELLTTRDDVRVNVSAFAGLVFNDLNSSQAQDPGEDPISGVTIQLYSPGPDGLLDTADDVLEGTTTTNSEGRFIFDALLPGAYLAKESDPSGYISTSPNKVQAGVPLSGAAYVEYGDKEVGTISGIVFIDLNGNGRLDPDELGMSGVTVDLVDSLGNVVKTTTTGSGGFYQFTAVEAGIYTVFQHGVNFYFTTTGYSVPVSLPTGGSASANFGLKAVDTISGVVYHDTNGSQIQDPSELGLPGVTVSLLDQAGNVVSTTLTGLDGAYIFFHNLTPGTYFVQETDPAGYTSSTSNLVPVSLAVGGSATANFGDLLQGMITGVVYKDMNGNLNRDPTEGGISGVLVRLYTPGPDGVLGSLDDVLVGATSTIDDGTFLFSGVTSGTYRVLESDPSGYVSTTSNNQFVNVPTGGSGSTSFGDKPVGTISGVVFFDLNGDGYQESSEKGIGGVLITLLHNGIPVTTTTSESGLYQFTVSVSGTFTVTETDPTGFTSSTPNSWPVTLLEPGASGSANFGDLLIGSISGVVYNDLNGNQAQDPDEPGIGNVPVRLQGTNNATDITLSTAGNGSYLFTGVAGGSYSVTESDPTGFTSTTPNLIGVVLPANTSATVDFGDQVQGTVSGVVYNDLDRDGYRDPGEPGLGGVLITLQDGGSETATTTPDGLYLFLGVPADTYSVVETDPAGFLSQTPNTVPVTVTAGGSASANFGDYAYAGVSGLVFWDKNKNGVRDSGEPGVADITVILFSEAGSEITRTLSGAAGGYFFNNLPPAGYYVQFITPEGFLLTTRDAGYDERLDSDALPDTGDTETLFLRSFSIAGNMDAGLVTKPTAVLVSAFSLQAQGGGKVLVRWRTSQEITLVGFRLYRSADPRALGEVVTPGLIPASLPGSPLGAQYEYLDSAFAAGSYYWLEIISLQGTQFFGPVTLAGHSTFLPVVEH